MKSSILAFVLACGVFASGARAAWTTKELPVNAAGTATTVAVSTSAWTLLPAASTLPQREFTCASNAAANTASMFFVLSAAAPTVATTTWAYELEKGETVCFPAGPSISLYGVSGHTAAENVRLQEWGQ